MRRIFILLAIAMAMASGADSSVAAEPSPAKLLFLGDNGHHQPATRFKILAPVMKARGIELVYTDKVDDLNAENLANYDGLVIYANQERISPEQEQALIEYVESGKGFIPLHCASYCFLNSPKYIELVGAQFSRHGTGTFRVVPTDEGAKHPLLSGYRSFESWDETYVHAKHNEKDRTVLEYRDEPSSTGSRREPWTWIRSQGQGRIFYTAWGHDERTFGNPGFHNLVERGIRWAIGQDVSIVPPFVDRPEMTRPAADARPFEYVEAKVPFYPAGKQWGTNESGPRKMQLPLPPEESMKHIVTPVGFQVELVVSEPQLEGKPIFMTWDERGRLWVCETYDYPNELQPPGQGRDRIRICEDTDGDGKSDKFTVFAEKLSIPTAIAFYRGGAIVQDGTETIYLKDTDGDDKADLKKTLITGWNLRDTHGGVSNFQYGLDNWYWGMQGYNNSRPVLTNGKGVSGFGQGFFRFKVEGDGKDVAVTDLEFLRSTNNNTWGLGFSEEGIAFGSTANGNPSEYMPIPNRYYEQVRGWSSSRLEGIAESNRFEPVTENVRQVDHHGGFTAAAGHALYTARNYPREYWNRTAFVCEPTGHLVATFVITSDGAGFRSKNSWNLFASHDEWTAPIMAEVGPDGNVWVLDWYNYIVQHNPTPQGFRTGRGAAYESDLRDKKHGRVYRLRHVGQVSNLPQNDRAGYKPAPLGTPEQLVAALKSDNLFWRRHAQRLLVERGIMDVVPALTALVQDKHVDELGLNVGAIHALWALHGLGAFNDGQSQDAYHLALAGLHHDSPGVLRNAVQIAPHTELALRALLQCQAFSGDVNDQRRLMGLLALADWPQAEMAAGALSVILESTEVQNDQWLLDAATAAAAGQGELFLVAVSKRPYKESEHPRALERIAIVAEHIARGGSADLGNIFATLQSSNTAVSQAIISGLSRGWPRDNNVNLSTEHEESLVKTFEKATPTARGQLLTLAAKLGTNKLDKFAAEIAASFMTILEDEAKPDRERLAAAAELVAFRRSDEAVAATILDLITPRSSPELAAGLLDALRQSESLAVATALIERMGKWTPAIQPAALRLLLSRAEWTRALLEAAEKGTADLGILSLDQKQALAAHPDRRIARQARELLAKGGGLPNADRQKVVEELLPLTQKKGDPAAGKIVFTKQCAKCHTHSGEGSKVGPDLTGMAVHPKAELLVHLIDPSRSVEGNFRVYSVLTIEGQTLSGLLASETKTAIELIDAEAKKHTLLREDIDQLVASSKSLMPEGFEKQVTQDDITNLLEFLTQRGKFLPLPLDKVATVVSTKDMFFGRDGTIERLEFSDWTPKTFDGVPFVLVDPQGDQRPNVVLLNGPNGVIPPRMPRSVMLPVNGPAKAIHMLSGISGWGFPLGEKGSVSLIVRLTYEDGQTEDHQLKNGEHFADYIRRVDVPGSKFAYQLRGQQLRYLSVQPQRQEPVKGIEFVKGDDATAPIVVAVTVEGP